MQFSCKSILKNLFWFGLGENPHLENMVGVGKKITQPGQIVGSYSCGTKTNGQGLCLRTFLMKR